MKMTAKAVLRILLSPLLTVLTVLLIPSIGKALVYLPLIFALSVSLPNMDKLKIKSKALGVLISVLQSYTVFMGLALVTFFSDEFLQETTVLGAHDFELKGIILVTLGGYLAALLLFYFFTLLFKSGSKRFIFLAITICYALIVLVMQVFSKNEFLQFGVEKFASFLVSWIIFMSLAFSMALNKPTLEELIHKIKS